ncbi:MAG: glycosyltransferase family 4 protein [Chloroflexi bacterium]|nr:glycosyltransferase family 4 protein [Chloroflexota bacterium]MCL5075138.1 glycosyltransferase family 4 protein [Chloroflexota bacterium]
MKIALVSPYDYPYPGGVTQHIHHLEEEFRRLGHQVKIIAPSSSDKEELARENIIKVGNVVSIPANGSVARITLSLRLSGRVKRILDHEQFDVVHLHEPMLPALPLTVLHHSRALNIGTFHAYWGTNIAYFYAKPILKRFFNKLDGRIAVSEAALGFVSRHFPGDYTIIPNGINLQRFGGDVPPIAELRDGKLNILFVGRLEKRKGFKYLLKAFPLVKRALPQARLIVVGAYSEGVKARYEAYVARHNLQDIIFTGYVTADMLPRYYRTCDVFCAPSTGGESFGIVLLEAMASGKPVVASDIEGYRLVVSDSVDGLLVPPKDEEALAETLIRLLQDPSLGYEMGQRGALKAQDYSWSKVARRVLNYYQSVMRSCGMAPIQSPLPQPSPLRVPGLPLILLT